MDMCETSLESKLDSIKTPPDTNQTPRDIGKFYVKNPANIRIHQTIWKLTLNTNSMYDTLEFAR